VAGLVVSVTVATLVIISLHDPWWLVWRAWGFVLLGAVTGAAIVWSLRVPPRDAVVQGTQPEVRQPTRPHDQSVLAADLVDLLDAAPSDSLRYRIRRTLSDAGIVEYAADGEVFDPERHNVVDLEWTDDPTRSSRVARTLRPGFADGAHIVRAADVLVYRESHTASREESRRTER
jgi:hypothetical protein